LPFKANSVKHLAESPITGRLLTIAGYDPSSGAGVTADLQVFAAHGFTGISAITALTVQSSRGVQRVEPVPLDLLAETLDFLGRSGTIDGVKIGMLGTAGLVNVVTDFLGKSPVPRERIVLDPVIRSSSGAELLEPEGVRRVVEELLPLVGWVTPNLDEAAWLLAEPVGGREALPDQTVRLAKLGEGHGLNVVVTGGHLDSPDDFLRTAAGQEAWIPGQRVEARSVHGTHGTGCVFSSALLCRLLLGDTPAEAVRHAKQCVVDRLMGDEPSSF
jgi:hydroxymethylpyrimidine/phosphomethylpyrimidine kinase